MDRTAPETPQSPAEALPQLPEPARLSGLGGLPAWGSLSRATGLQLLILAALTLAGLLLGLTWLALTASLGLAALALGVLLPPLLRSLNRQLQEAATVRLLALIGLPLALLVLAIELGWLDAYLNLWQRRDWEAIGAIGEGVVGAFGQILVALVALTIAWQQVRVDLRLTGQQNRITQAQTIDSFIHGISELIIDEEGLLEDWPLERMLAEGRLAAVLGSIDADGKARVLRFLSNALLLSPLRRDARLGRAILDGQGSYELDWREGVAVVRLQSMLRGCDLSRCDLRGVDLHGADLRGVNFSGADLSEANLAGANLSGAVLDRAILEGTRLFFGRPQTATPCGQDSLLDLVTGAGSGAEVADASFRGVRRLDAQQHYYLASWSGSRGRASLPGGCRSIPNQLVTTKD